MEAIKADMVDNSEIGKLKREIADLKSSNDFLRHDISRLEGIIKGLKFALRVNGISGKEVDTIE